MRCVQNPSSTRNQYPIGDAKTTDEVLRSAGRYKVVVEQIGAYLAKTHRSRERTTKIERERHAKANGTEWGPVQVAARKSQHCALSVLLVEPKLWHKIAHEMGMDSAVWCVKV